MNAIDGLLEGLIDYAGLYPPAELDMHSAVRRYLEYSRSNGRRALGRFIVSYEQFPYLWDAAGDYARGMRLGVLATVETDWDDLHRLLDKGYKIEAVEIKSANDAAEIERVAAKVPDDVACFFEVPLCNAPANVLAAVQASGARIKLRMGGDNPGAFPTPRAIAHMLAELSERRLVFKATAGLHHPLRGRFAINYDVGSPTAVMHGFMNLACAAAVLYFGGEEEEACEVLEEEWPGAWQVSPESMAWKDNSWNADELREVREKFFAAIGSCSFEEPVHELEALRWI